jgi:hypothetical protein
MPQNRKHCLLVAPVTIVLRLRPDAAMTMRTVNQTLQNLLFTPLYEPNLNKDNIYRIFMAYKNPMVLEHAGTWKNVVKPCVRCSVQLEEALLWELKAGITCWGQISDITTIGDVRKASVLIFDHFSAQVTLPSNSKHESEYENMVWIQFTISSVLMNYQSEILHIEGEILKENNDGIQIQ